MFTPEQRKQLLEPFGSPRTIQAGTMDIILVSQTYFYCCAVLSAKPAEPVCSCQRQATLPQLADGGLIGSTGPMGSTAHAVSKQAAIALLYHNTIYTDTQAKAAPAGKVLCYTLCTNGGKCDSHD